MKNKKLSLILAGILTVTTILTGCGGSKAASTDSGDNKISIMLPLFYPDAPTKDNNIEKKLKELTGYDVDITWVPNSSYGDKVSITMASDKVPNIIVSDKDASTVSNVKKGAFWKLDDYLKDYPNLSKGDKEISNAASFNGATYGIYRGRDVIRSCVMFRKDWLDKLGLKVPTTLDEFTNVLEKFKNDDPDGNGVNDTVGMVIPQFKTLNSNSPFDEMAVWFGAPNTTTIKDGKVVPDFMTDEYMKSLDYFKKLYDDGLMNNDFATLDSNKWDEPFVNGKAGVIVDTQSRALSDAKKLCEKLGDDGKFGDKYVTMVGNIKTDAGDFILPTKGYSGQLMMPKAGNKTEKDLKKALDFIDKCNSQEAIILLNNGIEGTHYEMKDGVFTPSTDKNVIYESNDYAQLSTGLSGYLAYKVTTGNRLEKERQDIMDNGTKKAVFDPCGSLISDVMAKKGAQLGNIMFDARIQYIAGQIDKSGYKAAQDLWLSTGGQEYIDELTKLYNENSKK